MPRSTPRSPSPDPLTADDGPTVSNTPTPSRIRSSPKNRRLSALSASVTSTPHRMTPAANSMLNPWRIKVVVEAERQDGGPVGSASRSKSTKTIMVPLGGLEFEPDTPLPGAAAGRKTPARKRGATPGGSKTNALGARTITKTKTAKVPVKGLESSPALPDPEEEDELAVEGRGRNVTKKSRARSTSAKRKGTPAKSTPGARGASKRKKEEEKAEPRPVRRGKPVGKETEERMEEKIEDGRDEMPPAEQQQEEGVDKTQTRRTPRSARGTRSTNSPAPVTLASTRSRRSITPSTSHLLSNPFPPQETSLLPSPRRVLSPKNPNSVFSTSPNSSSGSIGKLPSFASFEDLRTETSNMEKEEVANSSSRLGDDTLDETLRADKSRSREENEGGNEIVPSSKEFSTASAHTLPDFLSSPEHSYRGFSPIGGPDSDSDFEPEPAEEDEREEGKEEQEGEGEVKEGEDGEGEGEGIDTIINTPSQLPPAALESDDTEEEELPDFTFVSPEKSYVPQRRKNIALKEKALSRVSLANPDHPVTTELFYINDEISADSDSDSDLGEFMLPPELSGANLDVERDEPPSSPPSVASPLPYPQTPIVEEESPDLPKLPEGSADPNVLARQKVTRETPDLERVKNLSDSLQEIIGVQGEEMAMNEEEFGDKVEGFAEEEEEDEGEGDEAVPASTYQNMSADVEGEVEADQRASDNDASRANSPPKPVHVELQNVRSTTSTTPPQKSLKALGKQPQRASLSPNLPNFEEEEEEEESTCQQPAVAEMSFPRSSIRHGKNAMLHSLRTPAGVQKNGVLRTPGSATKRPEEWVSKSVRFEDSVEGGVGRGKEKEKEKSEGYEALEERWKKERANDRKQAELAGVITIDDDVDDSEEETPPDVPSHVLALEAEWQRERELVKQQAQQAGAITIISDTSSSPIPSDNNIPDDDDEIIMSEDTVAFEESLAAHIQAGNGSGIFSSEVVAVPNSSGNSSLGSSHLMSTMYTRGPSVSSRSSSPPIRPGGKKAAMLPEELVEETETQAQAEAETKAETQPQVEAVMKTETQTQVRRTSPRKRATPPSTTSTTGTKATAEEKALSVPAATSAAKRSRTISPQKKSSTPTPPPPASLPAEPSVTAPAEPFIPEIAALPPPPSATPPKPTWSKSHWKRLDYFLRSSKTIPLNPPVRFHVSIDTPEEIEDVIARLKVVDGSLVLGTKESAAVERFLREGGEKEGWTKRDVARKCGAWVIARERRIVRNGEREGKL